MHVTARMAMLSVALMGLGGVVPAMAAPAYSGPQPLTNAQLDRITAGSGTTLGLISTATSIGGNFVNAATSGGAYSSETPLAGNAFVDGGLVVGTAVATGTGTNSTSVSTSGTAGGVPLVTISGGGTLSGLMGSGTIGFTYVAGGLFFLP